MDQTDMYAQMYTMVVCAVADAIDELDGRRPLRARKRLADALNETEDFYLEHREGNFGPLTQEEKKMLRELREEMAEEYRENSKSP